MPLVLAVALGGALGAVSRYGLDRAIESRSSSSFPWATLAVNVSGCLLVGFLIAAVVDRHEAPAWVRAGLIVGFCGGYTTFSTFAQETLDLAEGPCDRAGRGERGPQRRSRDRRGRGGHAPGAGRLTFTSSS